MNPTSLHPAAVADTHDSAGLPVAGLLLDALAHRDFAAMASCLDPDVRFRALVPRGPLGATGAAETMGYFQRWFGGDDDFEVVDASIGQVRSRLYLRWRVQMQSATDPSLARIAEQHVFASAGERIKSFVLLCSGFQADQKGARP